MLWLQFDSLFFSFMWHKYTLSDLERRKIISLLVTRLRCEKNVGRLTRYSTMWQMMMMRWVNSQHLTRRDHISYVLDDNKSFSSFYDNSLKPKRAIVVSDKARDAQVCGSNRKKSAEPRAEIFFTSIVQIHKISSDWNRALASLLHLFKKTLNWRAALLEAKTESCSWLLWLFSSLLFFFVYVARLTYIHPMRSWTGSSIRLFFISEQFSLLIARNQSCSTLLSFARKGGLVSALKKHWNRSGW